MDVMRWRYGDTNPVVAAVSLSTVIEIGDLLFLYKEFSEVFGYARPASEIIEPLKYLEGIYPNILKQQLWFKERFLGVAMQRSRQDDSAPIRVATTGVFEFDCLSNFYELGDWVAVGNDGSVIRSQLVVSVQDKSFAIARVAKRFSTPTSAVLIDVRSTVMTGGV